MIQEIGRPGGVWSSKFGSVQFAFRSEAESEEKRRGNESEAKTEAWCSDAIGETREIWLGGPEVWEGPKDALGCPAGPPGHPEIILLATTPC